MSDFAAGALTFTGNDLGWTPQVTRRTRPAMSLPVPRSPRAPTPACKQGGALASAAAGKGFGSSTLSAGLDLQVPVDHQARRVQRDPHGHRGRVGQLMHNGLVAG